MKICYNQEKDTLEIVLRDVTGNVQKTNSPYVMQIVDSEKKIVGFSILKISTLKDVGSRELLNLPETAWTDFKLWYEMKS
jgi:hypothetical protein